MGPCVQVARDPYVNPRKRKSRHHIRVIRAIRGALFFQSVNGYKSLMYVSLTCLLAQDVQQSEREAAMFRFSHPTGTTQFAAGWTSAGASGGNSQHSGRQLVMEDSG
jgi:hypothetical protein